MNSPYVRRLRLAEELRFLRMEAGVTHEQLAKMIGESRAQISRLENGHVVDQSDIMKILDALKVEDDRWMQVIKIAREAGERGWWESNKAMGERQALYANLEAGARNIREFQMTFVPGLLQTPEFAEARMAAEGPPSGGNYSAADVVEARDGRQRMLRRPGGPVYEVIIDEVAIRRPAASGEVISAQLYHIAAVANGVEKITVRVLPMDAQIAGYNLPRSAFALYTFDDPGDPTVVMVDTVTADQTLTEDTEVKQYEDLYERLRNATLPIGEGLELLVDAAKRHHLATL